MTPIRELQRQKGTLQFARKLLTAAIVVELPIVIEIALRQADLLLDLNILGNWQMPKQLFVLICVSASILAMIGFTIVCRSLALWEGNLEDTEFAQRTRLLGSMKIAAGVQFFFYLTFLAPLFNLVPVAWAKSKASGAINDLDQMMTGRRK